MIHAARMCGKFIMPLKVALLSALVVVLLPSTVSAQALPSVIHETEGGFYIGTWTWNGHGYNASWTNGALAVLTVQSFTPNSVVIDRTDISGSVSFGVVGVYTGQISSDGNSIVNGVLNWTYGGNSFTEGWTGSWALQASVALLDPALTLFVPNTSTITSDLSTLASNGRNVSAIAADGVAQLVVSVSGLGQGDQINVSLLDENGNPAPTDGEDGTLSNLIAGTAAGPTSVSPTPQGVNGQYEAFVIYQSPIDFARVLPGDNAIASRQLTIRVTDRNNNVLASTPVKLLRPPIFFVHGLWSGPSTWDEFDQFLKTSITGVNTYRADYKKNNGDSVSYNTPNVLIQAYTELNAFRATNNAAAAQLDFIVHSMGGLISDTMPTLPLFRTPGNYGQGLIHKLITVDTPYGGSPFATGLDHSLVGCKFLLGKLGAKVGGAVGDLDPENAFGQTFNSAPAGYSKHAIASYVTPAQSQEAESLVNGLIVVANTASLTAVVVDTCYSVFVNGVDVAPPNFTFSAYFSTIGDRYSGASDLIVSEESQLAQYSPGTTADLTSGLAHSHIAIPFLHYLSIAGALDSGAGTPMSNPANVLNLLNSPTKGSLFVQ